MAKWHYQKNGVTHGPIDSAQLKQLAIVGELVPDDLLRRDDMQGWTKAGKVNGLFTTAPQPKSAPPVIVSTSVAPSEPSDAAPETPEPQELDFWHSVPVVLALTTFIFPIGLVLVWTHPCWVKRTKIIWTACCGIFLLVVVATNSARKAEAVQKLADAHQHWDAGRKAEAVNVYRLLVERDLSLFDDSDKPTVLQRLIEFDLAGGAKDAARKTWEHSKKEGVTVTLSSVEGKQFLDHLQAEQAAAQASLAQTSSDSEKPLRLLLPGVWSMSKDGRADFNDNTEKYRGKLIEMQMEFSKQLPFGDACEFFVVCHEPKVRFELNIDIPEGMKMPKSTYGDEFVITFRCTNGDLEFGNVATKIERK